MESSGAFTARVYSSNALIPIPDAYVTVTRKKGDWYDFLEPELDAEGNLPENKAYVIVNTTITQNGENDFWLNSIWLGFFDYDLKIGQIEMDGTTLLKEDNGDYSWDAEMFEGVVIDTPADCHDDVSGWDCASIHDLFD